MTTITAMSRSWRICRVWRRKWWSENVSPAVISTRTPSRPTNCCQDCCGARRPKYSSFSTTSGVTTSPSRTMTCPAWTVTRTGSTCSAAASRAALVRSSSTWTLARMNGRARVIASWRSVGFSEGLARPKSDSLAAATFSGRTSPFMTAMSSRRDSASIRAHDSSLTLTRSCASSALSPSSAACAFCVAAARSWPRSARIVSTCASSRFSASSCAVAISGSWTRTTLRASS
ncbi:hypothetical protein HRbin26_01569 [bacterium HR26]|nr:hypothetical protein HRbin26_01569 [bacterium HR26]